MNTQFRIGIVILLAGIFALFFISLFLGLIMIIIGAVMLVRGRTRTSAVEVGQSQTKY
jgi:uncharacterized membrane protein